MVLSPNLSMEFSKLIYDSREAFIYVVRDGFFPPIWIKYDIEGQLFLDKITIEHAYWDTGPVF